MPSVCLGDHHFEEGAVVPLLLRKLRSEGEGVCSRQGGRRGHIPGLCGSRDKAAHPSALNSPWEISWKLEADAWSLLGQTGAPGHLATFVSLSSSKKCQQLLIFEGTPHTFLEISPQLLLVSGSSLHLTDEELRPAGRWDDFPRLTEKEIREAGM